MLNRSLLSWAAVVASAAILCWHAQDSRGQDVSGYSWPVDFEPSDDESYTSAFPQFPSTQTTIEQLSDRLQQTEARLSALQAAQAQASSEGPSQAAIEGGLAKALRERFDQIQDPAITTVNQQTRNTSGAKKSWFDRLSIRGYAQFRFNEVLWDDPEGAPPHHVGDSSIGDNQSFLIRRARLILSGDVSDHMYVYIQPDFAASVPGSPDANHFTQLRDCYCDVYFDQEKVHRLRIGQSKVPYCWENMHSSSNRIPLDRNDGLNSGVRNERDLGLFYYYTPDYAQDLFKYVLDNGL
ncbi:MAG: OprO/OprP family phosphate-selective porin, partial [Planctomycetes bacterium]|nr:OprO/OprP family phosphate-selective porin [Planctomycetota bacterium]